MLSKTEKTGENKQPGSIKRSAVRSGKWVEIIQSFAKRNRRNGAAFSRLTV